MDEEHSLDQLSAILEKLSDSPLDVALHAQNILLSQRMQDDAQLAQAAWVYASSYHFVHLLNGMHIQGDDDNVSGCRRRSMAS